MELLGRGLLPLERGRHAGEHAEVVELVPPVVGVDIEGGVERVTQALQQAFGRLAVPAHLPAHDRVQLDPAFGERPAEDAGLLPARLGEHVVVLGVP